MLIFLLLSQYRIPVTKESVAYHFFNQFGIAGRIGEKKEPELKPLPPAPEPVLLIRIKMVSLIAWINAPRFRDFLNMMDVLFRIQIKMVSMMKKINVLL